MARNEERLPARRETGWSLSPWGGRSWGGPASVFGGSPWQMMRRMQEDMDRLFSQFFGGTSSLGVMPTFAAEWSPSMDVSENDREWCVEAELPGVNRDDIEVDVHDGHLILRAEMRQPAGEED